MSVPHISINPPSLQVLAKETSQAIRALAGTRSESFVSYGALAALGYVAQQSGGGWTPSYSGGGDAYVPDLTQPPVPTGLTVTTGFSSFFVEWDEPAFTAGHGCLMTEVYAANYGGSGPLPSFADAVLIGSTGGRGTLFIADAPFGVTKHFWIIWVSVDGVPSSPGGGLNGVSATGTQDPSALLTLIEDSIDTNHLVTALRDEIDLISASAGTPGSVAARILAEANDRAAGDANEATQRTTLATQMRGSYTGSDITAVTAGLLYAERTARETQDGIIATQIALLSAGSSNQFDHSDIWYYDSTAEGWTGNGTPTVSLGWIRPADHATDPHIVSPSGLNGGSGIDAVKYQQVRGRIRKHGTPVWEGRVYWQRTTDSTWDIGRSFAIAEPTYDADDIALVTWNMPWDGAIKQIRVDVSGDQDASNWFDIDWLAIGRPSPGASSAELAEEQLARINGLSAEATARETLSSIVTGLTDPTGATLGSLTSGLIYQERTTRASETGSLASSVSTLSTTVGGHTASISTQQTSINGILAQYTIKTVSTGGGGTAIAGIGLMATGGTGSEIVMLADRIKIAPPDASSVGTALFAHYTSPTTINGQTVPAGTYMQQAYIANGTINQLHFDKASGNAILATDGTFGTVLADTIKVKALNVAGQLTASQINVTTLSAISTVFGGVKGSGVAGMSFSGGVVEVYDAAANTLLATGLGVPWDSLAFRPSDAQILNSYAPQSNNLLRNAAFRTSADGWSVIAAAGGSGHNLPGWFVAGEGSVWLAELTGGAYINWYQGVPVVAGRRYEISALSGAHRCTAYWQINWHDAAGLYISAASGGVVNATELPGGTLLSDYKRIGGFAVAPAGAAVGYVILAKGPTEVGQPDSYAFFSRAYFGEASADQTDFSPWVEGGNGPGVIQPGMQITSSNIGTYIANLAIGSAQVSSLTADKISATSLAAITTTTGALTVDATGYLRGGSTNYMTGAGFFLGYHSGAYKMHIGDPAGQNFGWNGSNLFINGQIVTNSNLAGGITPDKMSVSEVGALTAYLGDLTLRKSDVHSFATLKTQGKSFGDATVGLIAGARPQSPGPETPEAYFEFLGRDGTSDDELTVRFGGTGSNSDYLLIRYTEGPLAIERLKIEPTTNTYNINGNPISTGDGSSGLPIGVNAFTTASSANIGANQNVVVASANFTLPTPARITGLAQLHVTGAGANLYWYGHFDVMNGSTTIYTTEFVTQENVATPEQTQSAVIDCVIQQAGTYTARVRLRTGGNGAFIQHLANSGLRITF